MPTPLPVYPSFSLVVTQAILTVKPPPQKKTGLALPSKLPASTRYHPYTRPAKDSFDDDLLMTTVDYRFSPPPQRLPSPNPAVSYHPTVHVSLAPPPDSMLVETSDEEIETDATDVSDASDASDASHGSYNAAVDTLEAVVRVNRDRNIIRRRPSLTALVVDLALHIKEKCRRLAASGSGSRK